MYEYSNLGHISSQPCEYSNLGHISSQPPHITAYFYIPHHTVYQDEKMCVVFDASAHSSSGRSLNDILLTGLTIQPDIFYILIVFRAYKVAFKADITKMYRQVLVDSRDRVYQEIIWFDDRQTPADFLLNTVTFRTSAAPFLAIRCLEQLASEHIRNCPQAAVALRQNTYVDDILVGANSVASTITLAQQVQKLLWFGCFELSKRAATADQFAAAIWHKISTTPVVLGMLRDPSLDILSSRMLSLFKEQHLNKASMLSYIASVYNPRVCLPQPQFKGSC